MRQTTTVLLPITRAYLLCSRFAYKSTKDAIGLGFLGGLMGCLAASSAAAACSCRARHRRTWIGREAEPKPSLQCGHTDTDLRTMREPSGSETRSAASASALAASITRSSWISWQSAESERSDWWKKRNATIILNRLYRHSGSHRTMDSSSIEQLRAQGNACYRDGRYEQARALYASALDLLINQHQEDGSLDSGNTLENREAVAQLYSNRAQAFIQERDFAAALHGKRAFCLVRVCCNIAC